MQISGRSWQLVLAQFFLLGFLLFSGPWYPSSVIGNVFFIGGWAIGIAAAWEFQRSKLSVFPEPTAQSQLLTTGIYRFIRHPLYTAVLMIAGSLALDHFSGMRLLAWGLLWVVLLQKMDYEEGLLQQKFPDYQHYMKNTRRLLPWIY